MGKQSYRACKKRSSCEDDNSKMWPLLNFYELQTEEFPDFSLLSKNPLKLNISKMNQIILIMFAEMEATHLYTN